MHMCSITALVFIFLSAFFHEIHTRLQDSSCARPPDFRVRLYMYNVQSLIPTGTLSLWHHFQQHSWVAKWKNPKKSTRTKTNKQNWKKINNTSINVVSYFWGVAPFSNCLFVVLSVLFVCLFIFSFDSTWPAVHTCISFWSSQDRRCSANLESPSGVGLSDASFPHVLLKSLQYVKNIFNSTHECNEYLTFLTRPKQIHNVHKQILGGSK